MSSFSLRSSAAAFCSAIQTFSWLDMLEVCHDFLERKDRPGMVVVLDVVVFVVDCVVGA